jgi:hypothetical protein
MVAPVLAAAIPAVVETVSELLRRWIPDPEQHAEAVQAVLSVMQQSDAAQVEVNKLEAQHASLFVAGWRPALGWLGVGGVAYVWIGWPMLTWASENLGWIAPPQLDLGELMTLLFGLLGLAAYRTYESVNGVIQRGR